MTSVRLGDSRVAIGGGGVRGGMAVMAKQVDVGAIGSYFESLSDPRHTRNRKHLLVDVAVIAVCGVLCGCDGPTAVHRWAVLRREWLDRHLALPNGVPSRDCIRRLLMALKPEAFQRCFQAWLADVQDAGATGVENADGRLVAIDGKACRGSKDPAKGLGALHVVSAWASEEGIALGQVATDAKSNEITAIPQLLDQLRLAGTLVTIDAMGCQKEIVAKVVEGGGDCVIAVKDNQPKLLEAVRKALFDDLEREREELQYRVHETIEVGHGRIDERSYLLTKTPRDFAAAKDWPWIKAVGYAVRITVRPDGTESDEVRFYLSTRDVGPKRFGEAVRGHWSIESLHWILDVVFREDDRRTRERTLADNLSWLRRFAVGLLKRHPVNDSIRGKMLACGYNTDYLTQVLSIK